MNKMLREFENAQLKSNIPEFRPGDTIRVSVRIIEGDKKRLQDFQGVCIARRGEGISASFTVRRISYGIGMERVFPLHSPRVEKIQVVRHGKVRRAKLYYLRKLRGKKARIQEIRRPAAKKSIALAEAKKDSPPPAPIDEAPEAIQAEEAPETAAPETAAAEAAPEEQNAQQPREEKPESSEPKAEDSAEEEAKSE